MSFPLGADVDEGTEDEPSVVVEEVEAEVDVEVVIVPAPVPVLVGAGTSIVVIFPLTVVSTNAAVGAVVVPVVVALFRTKGLACARAHKAIRHESERTILRGCGVEELRQFLGISKAKRRVRCSRQNAPKGTERKGNAVWLEQACQE